jgi:hypothetical protein
MLLSSPSTLTNTWERNIALWFTNEELRAQRH